MPIITTRELAQEINVSSRRISQWCQEGMPKVSHGKFDRDEVLSWLQDRRSDSGGPPSISLNEQRARNQKAQADMAELRLQAARGIVMLVSVHEQHLRMVFAAIKAGLQESVSREHDAAARAARQAEVDRTLRGIERRVESMAGDAARGVELTPGRIRNAGRMGG